MDDKILKVKNLRISFKTNTGTVKAVRGISFDLKKGKTLAIVGESGSGKSVTSKAVLGISANNVIVEDGEIIYDGKDLLTLSEANFSKIRGVKISMIFQDPLSALNPITRVGKQLTETMVLETKASRKIARKDVAKIEKYLKASASKEEYSALMNAKAQGPLLASQHTLMVDELISSVVTNKQLTANENATFDVNGYLKALDVFKTNISYASRTSKIEVEAVKVLIEKTNQFIDYTKTVKENIPQVNSKSVNKYVVRYLDSLKNILAKIDKPEDHKIVKTIEDDLVKASGKGIRKLLSLLKKKPLEEIDQEVYAVNLELFKTALDNKYAEEIASLDKVSELSAMFINDVLNEYADEEKANRFKEFAPLFKAAGEKSNQEFLTSLSIAKLLAAQAGEEVLNEYNQVKIKTIVKKLTPLFNTLKKCHSLFTLEADNIIDIYATMMKNYVKGIVDTIAYEEHLNKVLTSNNVESFYDLKPELRCKEREFVKDPLEYFNAMQKLNNKLLNHIDDLLKKYDSIEDSYVDALVYAYDKAVKGSFVKLTSKEAKERAISLMKEVGIPNPEKRFNQYPFEFSGGMRQRIVIAIALSGNPEILICDEPTTALDVTIQAQILELINRLKEEKNLSIIFITHDLGVVANMADDIAVMYAGKIVEYGSVYDIFYDPRHPYTWALLGSMPDLNTKGKLDAIPGTPPNMLLPPKGDAFAARNNYAIALDYEQEAPFFKISETHSAKTWLAHKDSIDVVPPKTVYERIAHSLEENSDNTPVYDLKKNSILEFIKNKDKVSE